MWPGSADEILMIWTWNLKLKHLPDYSQGQPNMTILFVNDLDFSGKFWLQIRNQWGEKCWKTLSIPFSHDILGSVNFLGVVNNFLVGTNSGTLVKDSFNRHHCTLSDPPMWFLLANSPKSCLACKSPVVRTHKTEQAVYKSTDYFIWHAPSHLTVSSFASAKLAFGTSRYRYFAHPQY